MKQKQCRSFLPLPVLGLPWATQPNVNVKWLRHSFLLCRINTVPILNTMLTERVYAYTFFVYTHILSVKEIGCISDPLWHTRNTCAPVCTGYPGKTLIC